jgi:hypothetical protein
MTHRQFKQTNRLILSILATMVLLLVLSLFLVGCVSKEELVYRRIYFADTNGVTTVYYPRSMEKDLRTPHNDQRWKYIASKDESDDGKAKKMLVKP